MTRQNHLFSRGLGLGSLASALKYAAYCAAILFILLSIMDSAVLPAFDRRGLLRFSPAWIAEDNRINQDNFRKVRTVSGVWESRFCAVQQGKSSKRRILVIGDSYVWGDGYANMNDIWWRRLERELHQRGFFDVEVIACGEGGWWTRRQLAAAREALHRYQPDCIVWGYCTNDPDERMVKQFAPEAHRGRLLNADPFITSALWRPVHILFPALFQQLVRLRGEQLLHALARDTAQYGYEYPDWELQLLRGANFERYRKTIGEVARFIDSAGIPVFFVTLPNFPNKALFEPRLTPVLTLLKDSGVVVYDFLDEFVAWGRRFYKPARAWGVNPANGHPGRAATGFYARKTADILERDFPSALPARNLAPPARSCGVNDCVPINLMIRPESCGVSFLYPDNPAALLRLPGGIPFVQLNLETPLPIRRIALTGPTLRAARLYVSYDESLWSEVQALGRKSGSKQLWPVCGRPGFRLVNTIRIAAEFSLGNHKSLSVKWLCEPP